MKSNFCHLHVHDQYSVLDGFGSCEMYVKKAKELGQKYLALTNHANIDGIIKFQKCCAENKIKPIIGSELYIVEDLHIKEDKEKRGHILVLIKNKIGWNNLTKMLSIANIEGFYKRPRIDYKTLLDHNEGLIISTACASSFIYNNNGMKFFDELINSKADVYLEIMPINYKEQKLHNKKILELKNKHKNINIISTNDCHYPYEEDSKVQEILLAIQTKVKWDDPKRWKFDSTDLFLKSRNEMLDSFMNNHSYIDKKIIDKSLDNTIDVAEKCDFFLKKSKLYLPKISEDPVEALKKLSQEGLYEKIISKNLNLREYKNRLSYELEVLGKLGFIEYFLIIQDIVSWCKRNNIMVGFGRGSVGGSLVAFLIGITNVDPIKHCLMFERFISPDRVDLPDIDVDFEDIERKKIREYIENKFGVYNTASVSTFLQMKSKMVFRDVCRIFNIPIDEVNTVSKNIDDFKEQKYYDDQRVDVLISDIEKTFSTIPECIKFKERHPEIIKLCLKLEGQVRGIGKHAAAIIVARDDLRNSDRCNITNRGGNISINWDKRDAEYVGMLKIDILGLSNLSIMHHVKIAVKEKYNIDIDFANINFKDNKILNEFSKGNCIGIFQFGSYGLRKLCAELKVDSFELLTHITAIYRPAFLRSGMLETFRNRRFGKNNTVNSDKLYDALKDTYGMIIYQEQVIQIVNQIAGMSFTDADKIRKLLDWEDKEELGKYRNNFINGCIKNGIGQLEAVKIWREMLRYGGYSFNKCLSKDTIILAGYNSCKSCWPKKKRMTIEQAYNKKIHFIWIYDSKLKKIKKVKIKKFYKTGKKEVFWVVVQSNTIRKIKTTKDHKFLTPNGYRPLLELKIGDKVMTKIGSNCGLKSGTFGKPPWNKGISGCTQKQHGKPKIWTREKQSQSAKKRLIHGHTNCLHTDLSKQLMREGTLRNIKRGIFKQTMTSIHKKIWDEMVKRNINEGFENEYIFLNRFSIDIANPDKKIAIEIQGDYFHANPKFYKKRNKTQGQNVGRDTTKRHLLEKEGWELIVLWENEIQNNLDNCVNKIECAIGDTLENPWGFADIQYIGSAGKEETYDIEVDDEEHNYIANMFVVHNSHAIGYTLLSYANMFCKVYYPAEFYCANLTFTGDKDKKEELLKDSISNGFKIVTPKIGESDSKNWVSKNKTIYMPFIEIKGIGEKYAEKILNFKNEKTGFFENSSEIKGKLKNILNDIGAFESNDKFIGDKLIPYNL